MEQAKDRTFEPFIFSPCFIIPVMRQVLKFFRSLFDLRSDVAKFSFYLGIQRTVGIVDVVEAVLRICMSLFS